MGLAERPNILEGNLDIQRKLHAWITSLTAANPDTLLNSISEYDKLTQVGVREEHVMRLSIRLEVHLQDSRIKECTYTVQMVNEVLDTLLPLAALSRESSIS